MAVQLDGAREKFQELLDTQATQALMEQFSASQPTDRRVRVFNFIDAFYKFICFAPCVTVRA